MGLSGCDRSQTPCGTARENTLNAFPKEHLLLFSSDRLIDTLKTIYQDLEVEKRQHEMIMWKEPTTATRIRCRCLLLLQF